MSDSKSGSKSDLSEPLLDEGAEKAGETPEKEMIEMEEKKDDAEGEKKEEKKEKKKKEKKEKAPKVKKEPGPSCIDTMSSGLDMNVRDANGLNCEIDLDFDNVLAEPAASHGFDPIWRLAFIIFTNTKLWIYKIAAAIIAIPMAILWGLVFSILTIVYIWLVRPVLRIVEVVLAIFKRGWTALMAATVAPLCDALGGIFAKRSSLVQSA
jgi:hypothetical protein